ncbi:hypothetical protein B6S12_06900 [Helicobacter valdiviensis]|uniref:Uncharacterized protein n=1 Tax=Helicobacter valdiviensis TaxID=1458358 RepID=A0A2W6MTW9_9HELI|nr:hypothetical protein [Helicobacter valdiviensis]PZT47882.1 hypothetical protein B6S12_06900 [Helicobacter valdiviensis]
MNGKLLFDELMDELSTQSLARLKLNIFDLNSYGAMVESAKLTTNMQKAIEQHGDNPNGFGQFFETLEIGKENIQSSYYKIGEKSFTTDELADIKKVYNNEEIGGKYSQERKENILANYSPEEIKAIATNEKLMEHATTNHNLIDVITIDKNGNITTEQLKAVNDNILGKKYNRYFEGVDSVRVDENTYNNAKEKLQQAKENYRKHPSEKNKETLKEYEEKFTKLKMGSNKEEAGYTRGDEKNKNHTDSDKVMKETLKNQAKETLNNIHQTGTSDMAVVMLSTFASGALWEIKDEFMDNNSQDFSIRIKRIITKTIEKGSDAYARGASFGIVDSLITIISQFFKKIGGRLKYLWTNIRDAAKSIWNAIYSYITGKITNYAELIKIILKSLFSAIMVGFAVALEIEISNKLKTILGETIADVLSIGISIFICSVAVILFSKTIDLTINAFFGICAAADMAKQRREEIERVYDAIMPKMIENINNLEKYITEYTINLQNMSEMSFNELQNALQGKNYIQANQGLVKLANIYGVNDLFETREYFDNFMASDETLKV